MIYKIKKPFIEAVKVEVSKLNEVRNFVGKGCRVFMSDVGWYKVIGDGVELHCKHGDYIAKIDKCFVVIDNNYFERWYSVE